MSYRFVSLIAVASLIGLVTTTAFAQVEQGTVTGVITDQSNAVMVGAKVVLTNVATKVAATTSTNQQGNYSFPYTPPGRYSISAEMQGFSAATVNNITLAVGQTATINITLATGAVKQEISVSAAAVLLDAQTSSLGNVVTTQQIVQLPLNGRNPYALLTLAPGVDPAGNSGTGPVIGGGRSNTSDVLFDGQETRNTSTNDIVYTPPLETVEEFKVITNNFSAEYGRSGGGILTAAGRSGTNEIHGSAYEFFRNNVLNANGWTNNRNGLKINPVRHNEFGFAIGGPVYVPKVYNGKNRTFFFFNYERIPDRSPDNVTDTVPTVPQRSGDFSQTTTTSGALIVIYDPSTTVPNPSTPGSYTRTAFPGNVIPSSRINPIALNLLQYYPLPNLPGNSNNWAGSATRQNTATKYYGRIDENTGDNNRIFFRYGVTYNPAITPGYTGLAFPGEGTNCNEGKSNASPWVAGLSDTVTFRPTLIGEFRVSYTRQLNTCQPRSAGFDPTSLGLPASLKSASTDALFPEFDVTDLTGLGPQRASHYVDAENTPEAQAHLTWLRGSHTLKGGIDYLFLAFNIFRPDYPSGDFGFTRAYTQGPDPSAASATSGYGLATLLLGAPTGGSFTVGPSLASSQRSYNIYFQDDWKVTRNLTLNLGARWEYQTPFNERYNQLAYFNPSATDSITGRQGVLSFTTPNHRYQSNPNQTDIAPRVGLAYTFMNNTVFRAGYGLFYLPGSGGIGASPGDLGSGSEASTPVFLGQPPAAPNTPPAGASIANPFASGLLTYPNTLIGNGIGAVFPNWATPVNQQWNANIQRTLPGDLLIEAAYLGSRGEHIWENVNVNAANPIYLSLGSQLNALVPNPFYGQITSGSLSTATVRQSSLLLPYPQYTSINDIRDSIGDSVYHALTVRADKRFSHGLLFQVELYLQQTD